jgi:predicted GNAT family N-acyltransferase
VFEGLVFKVADASERARALELRRKIYEEELGHHGIDDVDQGAHHLVACRSDGEIVAALRIVGPEFRPFDFEEFVTLADVLTADRLPAEISRFCVRREHRLVRSDQIIQLGMFKLAHAFARKHGFSDFLTLALPHLQNLYRIASFRNIGLTFEHPTWGRVQPMRLDLVALEAQWSRSQQWMARLLFATDMPNILV